MFGFDNFDNKDAIWQFQTSYLNTFARFADRVFNFIDPRLKPEIILIGIDNRPQYHFEQTQYKFPYKSQAPRRENPNFKIAQHEPTSNLQALDQILEIAKNFESDTSSPASNSLRTTRASIASLRAALVQILSAENIFAQRKIFISDERPLGESAEISGYTIFAVLLLDKSVIMSQTLQSFGNRQQAANPEVSFTQVVAKLVLRECVLALRDPFRGFMGEIIEKSSEELLHRAASVFMQEIGRTLFKSGGPNLFDSCNLISSLPYEGAEGTGGMVLVSKNDRSLALDLELESPFPLKELRKVRKFLELSKQDFYVVCNGAQILGLSRKTTKNKSLSGRLIIDFKGHFRWGLRIDNNLLLSVAYSQPIIERNKIDEVKFRSDLPRIFDGISATQIDHIWALVKEGITQKHGTMLVISNEAQKESQRLAGQAMVVKPVKLSTRMMLPLSEIDGAILMDYEGICYGIGVILDGPATDKGDSSRGARYNSAIKYFQSKKGNGLLIIIISEDRMVDLVPDLMPRVSHAMVTKNIEELKALANETLPDEKTFYNLMGNLKELEFYLRSDECKVINQNSKRAARKIKDSFVIDFLKKEFKPNKEMNDSYYLGPI